MNPGHMCIHTALSPVYRSIVCNGVVFLFFDCIVCMGVCLLVHDSTSIEEYCCLTDN